METLINLLDVLAWTVWGLVAGVFLAGGFEDREAISFLIGVVGLIALILKVIHTFGVVISVTVGGQ
jgi:hypothetical protein